MGVHIKSNIKELCIQVKLLLYVIIIFINLLLFRYKFRRVYNWYNPRKLRKVTKCKFIPPAITHLWFSDSLIFLLLPSLPPSLSLNLASISIILLTLPPSLIHLEFNKLSKFDHPVDSLPVLLSHLSFGDHFNHSINHLPPSLRHLSVGAKFNQSIDSLLLSSLTYHWDGSLIKDLSLFLLLFFPFLLAMILTNPSLLSLLPLRFFLLDGISIILLTLFLLLLLISHSAGNSIILSNLFLLLLPT